jgi:hypothetical protein
MARLMAVSLTEPQVRARARAKTVTRRPGWRMRRTGDQLTLCRKVMGRRSGEPIDRIASVEVTSVRREQLDAISEADVIAEGFPDMTCRVRALLLPHPPQLQPRTRGDPHPMALPRLTGNQDLRHS